MCVYIWCAEHRYESEKCIDNSFALRMGLWVCFPLHFLIRNKTKYLQL